MHLFFWHKWERTPVCNSALKKKWGLFGSYDLWWFCRFLWSSVHHIFLSKRKRKTCRGAVVVFFHSTHPCLLFSTFCFCCSITIFLMKITKHLHDRLDLTKVWFPLLPISFHKRTRGESDRNTNNELHEDSLLAENALGEKKYRHKKKRCFNAHTASSPILRGVKWDGGESKEQSTRSGKQRE